jgi:ribosomal protein L1
MLKLVKTASGVLNNIKNEKIKKELVKMVPEMLKTIDELLTHISAAGKMPQNKVHTFQSQ